MTLSGFLPLTWFISFKNYSTFFSFNNGVKCSIYPGFQPIASMSSCYTPMRVISCTFTLGRRDLTSLSAGSISSAGSLIHSTELSIGGFTVTTTNFGYVVCPNMSCIRCMNFSCFASIKSIALSIITHI